MFNRDMKTELANYLNNEAEKLKANQKIFSYEYHANDGEVNYGGVFYAKDETEARKIVSNLIAPRGENVVLVKD
jgi:hypothetical protein